MIANKIIDTATSYGFRVVEHASLKTGKSLSMFSVGLPTEDGFMTKGITFRGTTEEEWIEQLGMLLGLPEIAEDQVLYHVILALLYEYKLSTDEIKRIFIDPWGQDVILEQLCALERFSAMSELELLDCYNAAFIIKHERMDTILTLPFNAETVNSLFNLLVSKLKSELL